MFTWICPQCGREVPPAYTECPDCEARQKAEATQAAAAQPQGAPVGPPGDAPAPAAPPPPAATQTPAAPQYAPQPQYAPPQPAAPQYAPPQAAPGVPLYSVPAPRSGIPTWLMSVLFALGFIGLGAGVYLFIGRSNGNTTAAQSGPAPTLQNVPANGATATESAMQKYIEVTGIRFLQNSRKATEAHFVVVNHSGADIADLTANVSIFGRTDTAQEEAVGTFSFKVPSIGAYESKEVTAPVDTKLKVYELPDWQNVSTKVKVISP